MFRTYIYPSISILVLMTILTGVLYPGLITIVTKIAFPQEAEGSLIGSKDGKILGSELIGQNFSKPEYFWGRLSTTSPAYNAANSSGSNLGAANPKLIDAVKARMAELNKYPHGKSAIPVDLVTASGSGLDPHISPAAAYYQIPRVTEMRKISVDKLKALVDKYTEEKQFGILGQRRVNVLKLNLALDGKI